MVLDKAPGATVIFLVMIGSIIAELIVVKLFINPTTTQMVGLIVLELFSLTALLFAGRYYYIARDEHDHYEAAELLCNALSEEERATLRARLAEKRVTGRVKFHLRQLLGETA
jgi:hypothetical protein